MKNWILMFGTALLVLVGGHSCQAQDENEAINEMGPDVRSELVYFFKKGTDWKEILEFNRTVISDPAPNGTGFSSLPGIMTVVKIEIQGYEGGAINFQPDSTDDEKALVKRRVSDSKIVFRHFENVIPNEIPALDAKGNGS